MPIKFDPLNENTWAQHITESPVKPALTTTYDAKLRAVSEAYRLGEIDRWQYARLCSQLNRNKNH